MSAAPVDGDAAAARVPHQHQHDAGVWVLRCMDTWVLVFLFKHELLMIQRHQHTCIGTAQASGHGKPKVNMHGL